MRERLWEHENTGEVIFRMILYIRTQKVRDQNLRFFYKCFYFLIFGYIYILYTMCINLCTKNFGYSIECPTIKISVRSHHCDIFQALYTHTCYTAFKGKLFSEPTWAMCVSVPQSLEQHAKMSLASIYHYIFKILIARKFNCVHETALREILVIQVEKKHANSQPSQGLSPSRLAAQLGCQTT